MSVASLEKNSLISLGKGDLHPSDILWAEHVFHARSINPACGMGFPTCDAHWTSRAVHGEGFLVPNYKMVVSGGTHPRTHLIPHVPAREGPPTASARTCQSEKVHNATPSVNLFPQSLDEFPPTFFLCGLVWPPEGTPTRQSYFECYIPWTAN